MKLINTIAVMAGLAMAIGSCGSGTDPVVEPDPTLITGAVEITGTPLASLSDPTAVGEQDETKWSLKLIDPVEDVDSVEIIVGNTTFNPAAVSTEGEYLLSVGIEPAVDLSGGTLTTTPVTINIPVTVEAGETTQVFATVNVIPPVTTSSVHAASQAPAGGRLQVSYTVETPLLSDTGFLEIDWNTNQIRRDTNGDQQFGDEEFFTDSNRDGISDESSDQLKARKKHPERFTVEGTLIEFDHQRHRLLVGDSWYRVTELTKVTEHTRRVHLSDLQVGQLLRIRGHNSPNDNKYAEEIRILPHGDGPPN